MPDRVPPPDVDFYRQRVLPLMRGLFWYHRYRVEGLEHLPATGPTLVLMNHPALTYDSFMLQAAVFERTGRLARGLGDRFWYSKPVIGPLLVKCGIYESTPTIARALLEQGELVGLIPGGQWEALRPSTQRFTLRWERRTGFARVALQTGAKVVLAADPAGDLAYTVYESRLTDLVYRRWHLPAPIMRGLGPTLLPRPVQLTHYLREPIDPPAIGAREPTDDEVMAFAEQVRLAMVAHMAASRARAGV